MNATKNLRGEFAAAAAFVASDAQLFEITIKPLDNFLRVCHEQALLFGHGLVVYLTTDLERTAFSWLVLGLDGVLIGDRFRLGRFDIEIALNRVENAVDELSCFVSRETARDFQSFVDRDRPRRRFLQKFVNREAEQIAIDQRHPRDAPMFGARTDAFVNFFEVREGA